jgi:putative peptidoglycan lipid II flippase
MTIQRNLMTVAAGTAASRLLGFLRDILIAATLGYGPIADAFVVAFRLPNLFRRLLAEGAFNAALVPLYAEKLRDDPSSARDFVGDVLAITALLLLGVTVIGEWFMPEIVALLAPGFLADTAKFGLTVQLSRTAFPFLGFATLAAIFAGLLNAVRRFAVTAVAAVALNIVLVVALAVIQWQQHSGTEAGAHWLCAAVSAAGFVQLCICFAGIRSTGIVIGWHRPVLSPTLRQWLMLSVPGLIVSGIAQVNGFIASFVGSASTSVVSYLYYADRVYQLPLGIVGTAIGLVVLPNLNRALLDRDEVAAQELLRWVLEFSLFLIIPAAVALAVVAQPVVTVLFERGAFDTHAGRETAAALAVYAIGLPGYIVAKALQPAFFARKDLRTPFAIAALGAGADLAVAVLLFTPLAQIGIALAAAVSGWFNAFGLATILCRRRHLRLTAAMGQRLARLACSAATMGVALSLIASGLGARLVATQPLSTKMVSLAILCGSGLTIYLITAWLIGAIDRKAIIKSAG